MREKMGVREEEEVMKEVREEEEEEESPRGLQKVLVVTLNKTRINASSWKEDDLACMLWICACSFRESWLYG